MTQEEVLAKIEEVKKEQKIHQENFLMCEGALRLLNQLLIKE
jgi:hypothetical protein